MSQVVFAERLRVVCADGATRESCSLAVSNGAYAYFDSDGDLLDGDRSVTEVLRCSFIVSPLELGMITNQYGPLDI